MSYLYLNNSTKFWFYSENQTVCTPWWYSGTLLVKLVFKEKKIGLNPRKKLLVFTSCKSPVANAYQIIKGSYYRLLCKTKLLDFFSRYMYMYWKIQYVIEMTFLFIWELSAYFKGSVHDKFPPSVFDCQYADNFQKVLGQTRNFIE